LRARLIYEKYIFRYYGLGAVGDFIYCRLCFSSLLGVIMKISKEVRDFILNGLGKPQSLCGLPPNLEIYESGRKAALEQLKNLLDSHLDGAPNVIELNGCDIRGDGKIILQYDCVRNLIVFYARDRMGDQVELHIRAIALKKFVEHASTILNYLDKKDSHEKTND